MKNMNSKDQFDSKITELLDQLRETPERDPEIVEKNYKKYLAELDALPLPEKRPSSIQKILGSLGFRMAKQQNKENLNIMSNSRKRVALTIGVVVVIALIFLFGGSAATVMASRNAIPGDTLYPLKTTFENTRLSLSSNAETRVDLHLQYAEQRLEEIESLISEGRLNRIEPATKAFETHIKNALDEVKVVAEQDSVKASFLMTRIADALSRYSEALIRVSDYIPESLLNEVMGIVEFGGRDYDNENDDYDDLYDDINENMNDDDFDDNYNDDDEYSFQNGTTYLGDDYQCSGSYDNVMADNLIVPANATCTLSSAKIEGNISVHKGATLIAYDVRVYGNLQADYAAKVEISNGSYVGGNIQFSEGGALTVSFVKVKGNLEASYNYGPQIYSDNTIGGDIQVEGNTGGVTITNNTIYGDLECEKNNPAPYYSGNSVRGDSEGQCYMGWMDDDDDYDYNQNEDWDDDDDDYNQNEDWDDDDDDDYNQNVDWDDDDDDDNDNEDDNDNDD